MEKGSDLSAGGNLDRVYRFQWHGAAIKAETRVFDSTCLASARQSPSPRFSLLGASEPRVVIPGP